MEQTEIKIEDFLNEQYSQSAMYQSFRSIGNYIDGLRPSSRKVIHSVRKGNINTPSKVSQLAARVAAETEYLHGEGSLQSVVVNLARDFVGSNNYPLLQPHGNFGTRFVPAPAAARYIFTCKNSWADQFFREEDDAVLIPQEFEGSVIEPQFFVPVLPQIALNGSRGIGTGFAQNILPRHHEEIWKYLQGKQADLTPWFRGFEGEVIPDSKPKTWKIRGRADWSGQYEIEVTEIPIEQNLSSYVEFLEKQAAEKVIKSYEDLSEDDQFLFRIRVSKEFKAKVAEKPDLFYSLLGLEKKITENFTCVDEENKIREFDSLEEILDAFASVRVDFYEKRRLHLIDVLDFDLRILRSKIEWINRIIDRRIEIGNTPKKEIEKTLHEIEDFDFFEDESRGFDYLFRMPIQSLTKEKIEELRKEKRQKEKRLEKLKKSGPKDLWKEDMEDIV